MMSINFAMLFVENDVIGESAYFALFYIPFAFGIMKNFLGIFIPNNKRRVGDKPLSSGAYIYPSLNIDYLITEILRDRNILAVVRNPNLFEKYKLPILWLSKVEKENSVSPTHLEKILYWAVTMATSGDALIIDGAVL